MTKPPAIRWNGDLARPIRWNGPLKERITPTAADPEPSDEAEAENLRRYRKANLDVLDESLRKLELLKEYFGIPASPASDRLLALRLAIQFVPGFGLVGPRGGRGRPRNKWTDGACIGLLIDVENIKDETCKDSDLDALAALLRGRNEYNSNSPPRTEGGRRKMARSLQARLTEARRRASEPRLAHWFAPEVKELRRQLFGLGSPLRNCDFN
jgi:hypothetical protein